MFIPPKKYLDKLAEEKSQDLPKGKIFLKNSHLHISMEIADMLFDTAHHVYISYKPDVRRLFIVPNTDEVFRKLHEPSQQMLKDLPQNNHKSIALHEILIDNDLSDENRDLEYEIREKKQMLVIQF
jgi:aspartyl-tRNA synthetase